MHARFLEQTSDHVHGARAADNPPSRPRGTTGTRRHLLAPLTIVVAASIVTVVGAVAVITHVSEPTQPVAAAQASEQPVAEGSRRNADGPRPLSSSSAAAPPTEAATSVEDADTVGASIAAYER